MQHILGGSPVAGYSVGIVTLRTHHALVPGNVQHAQSFENPVIYQCVDLVDPWPLFKGEPWVADKVVAAAQILQDKGVRAIAGACGSFAYYQDIVAQSVNIPVFMSIMLQVPLLQKTIGPQQKLGIICASLSSMSDRLYADCGITNPASLVIREMRGNPHFDHYMDIGSPVNWASIEAEILKTASSMIENDPSISCILLQCSELPPAASKIQELTGLPVFDMTLLIRWLQMAADYQPYAGFLRKAR